MFSNVYGYYISNIFSIIGKRVFYETVYVINFNLYVPSTMFKRENKKQETKKRKKKK